MENQNPRYINPLTDFGFKKVFGDEDIMRDFLNDIIEPESPIVKVTFLDKEMPPETRFERGIIYDMRCLLDSGEEVIVEMQNRGQDYFRDRICYYMARAISSQGDRGDEDWKFQIHSVYGIFFMNFYLKENTADENDRSAISGKEEKKAETNCDICHVALTDVDTNKIFSDKLQMWLIQLPRYRKMKETDCTTNKDYWLYILTHLETMNTTVPFQAQKPIFHKLENVADMAKLTREERNYYHVSLDSFRTNLAVMDHERNQGRNEGREEGRKEGREEGREVGLKEGREVGLKEGREEGLKEGREEGLKEGLKEGREEGRNVGRKEGEYIKSMAIALQLKKMGMAVDQITVVTGLSEEQIYKL